MSDIYAGEQGAYDTQSKRTKAQEDQIKLAELMRIRDEEAAARAIKTRIANQALEDQARPQYVPPAVGEGQGLVAQMPTPNVPGDLVPQGMVPQEGLTGFGGMSTPQQGPMGMQPQEGLTGLGGMSAPTGMTPEQMPVEQPQQQAPAQGTLMSNLDKAEEVYTQAQVQVNQVKQIETELRKAGLHDEADKYVDKTIKQQEAAAKAQKAHIEAKEKALEYIGRSAKGFLEADDEPATDSNAAWQRMVLDAAANGIDPTEMLSIDPSQRRAYATYHYEQAKELKDQVGLEKTMLNIADKQQRAAEANATKERVATMVDASRAKNRELTQTRWEKQFGLSVYKTQEKAIRDNIGIDLSKTREMDKQIAAIETKIKAIKEFKDLSVKKTQQPAAIAALESEKSTLVSARDSLLNNVDSYQSSLQSMQKSFANSGYKAKDLESVPESAPSEQAAPSASPAAAPQVQPNSKVPANFKSEQEEALSYWKTKSPAAQAQIEETFKKSTGFDLFERGATPAGETKTEAAKPVPHLSPEAQKKADLDKLFLEKLNGTTVWEDIKDFGSGIKKSTNAFETFFQNKADSFNADVDSLAAMAKEKLQDKAFVSKLSPRALKNLKEMTSDTGASHKAYQESQTPFELPFLGSATASAEALGGRMASNKATKDLVSTATKANSGPAVTANMETLKQTLKNLSEKERIAKLRALGYKAEEAAKVLKEMSKRIPGRTSSTNSTSAILK